MAQSKTAVNANAGAPETMDKISPSLVPGQSIQKVGGTTNKTNDVNGSEADLNVYAGAPGQVTSDPQLTGAAPKGLDGPGPAAPGEGKIGGNVIPGDAGYDGTNKRSDSSVSAGSPAPGKGKIGTNVIPADGSSKVDAKTKSYAGGGGGSVAEHARVDETAGAAMDELAEDQGASDDFKTKARVIFEAALNEKLQLEVSRLEEEFSKRFEEEVTDIAEKVESFLNYTSQQWLEENKLVVENGIRNELSESFMQGLRSLFEDHYVTLPDEKYDIFESMVAKLDDMEDKLNEQIQANVTLSSRMAGFQRESVLQQVSWDLTEAGKDKLKGLAESVEFGSEEEYAQKLNVLKESFIGAPAEEPKTEMLEESAEAPAPGEYDGMSSSMAAYAQALSRTIKN